MKVQSYRAAITTITERPQAVFYANLLAFLLDNTINFYVNVPIFIVFTIFLLPIIWLNLFCGKRPPRLLTIFIYILFLSFSYGYFTYGFNKTNISDIALILLFVTSYFYYQKYRDKLTSTPVFVFQAVVTVMISFGLMGINSPSIETKNNDYLNLELVGISLDSLLSDSIPIAEFSKRFPDDANVDSLLRSRLKKYFPNRPEIDTMQLFGYKLRPEIRFDKKNEPAGELDTGRNYATGLFRIPHVAAYFFGVFIIFSLVMLLDKRKLLYLLPIFLFALLMLWLGIRTFLLSMLISGLVYLVFRKSLWYLVLFLGLSLILIMFRYKLFHLTDETILKPFAILLVNIVDRPEEISRLTLVRSLVMEIENFGLSDWFFGKTFHQSQLANLRNLFSPVWFHNDYISIVYAYGIFALTAYLIFLFRIYKDYSKVIKNSFLMYLFFYSLIIASVINGLYYYFPVLVMYVFIYLANKNRKVV
jgi:hypothetical protein